MKIRILICWMTIYFSSYAFSQSTQQIQYKGNFKKILLVVAMSKEANPIMKAFDLHKLAGQFNGLPMQAYQGNYAGLDIVMITNGEDPINKVQNVGTQPAVLATYLGIEHFHPDLIISIGTAGGIKNKGAQLKQIYISTKNYFYSRRIPSAGSHEYGLGGYTSINLKPIIDKTELKLGIICSSDSFDENQTDIQIINQEGCIAVDMEAAGVAWVSMLMKIPMFAMKGVTNYAQDKNGHTDYRNNLPYVTNELAQRLKLILNYFSANVVTK